MAALLWLLAGPSQVAHSQVPAPVVGPSQVAASLEIPWSSLGAALPKKPTLEPSPFFSFFLFFVVLFFVFPPLCFSASCLALVSAACPLSHWEPLKKQEPNLIINSSLILGLYGFSLKDTECRADGGGGADGGQGKSQGEPGGARRNQEPQNTRL